MDNGSNSGLTFTDLAKEIINFNLDELTDEEYREVVETANKWAYDIYVYRNIEGIKKMLEEDN